MLSHLRNFFTKLSETDTCTLGLYRVLLGASVFWNLMSRLPFFHYIYGNPTRDIGNGVHFYRLATTATESQSIFILTAIMALVVITGWKARWTIPITTLLFISTHSIGWRIGYGVDNMLCAALILASFMPMHLGKISQTATSTINIPALAFMKLYLGLGYISAGITKVSEAWKYPADFWEGITNMGWASPFGAWFFEHTPSWVLSLFIHATRPLEVVIGICMLLAAYTTFRYTALFLSLALHTGISIFMEVGFMPYYLCIILLFARITDLPAQLAPPIVGHIVYKAKTLSVIYAVWILSLCYACIINSAKLVGYKVSTPYIPYLTMLQRLTNQQTSWEFFSGNIFRVTKYDHIIQITSQNYDIDYITGLGVKDALNRTSVEPPRKRTPRITKFYETSLYGRATPSMKAVARTYSEDAIRAFRSDHPGENVTSVKFMRVLTPYRGQPTLEVLHQHDYTAWKRAENQPEAMRQRQADNLDSTNRQALRAKVAKEISPDLAPLIVPDWEKLKTPQQP